MNQRIVIPEAGKVVIEEAPMPNPGPGEALVKVLYGGICGSDLGTYRGTFAYVSYPRIPGHELAVEVMEVPDNQSGVKKGLLATVNPYFNCGKCYPCRNGRPNCCVGNQTLGAQRHGGFVKYFTIPVERIYSSRGLGVRETALVEPFCISYHGVKRAGIRPGEKVLVIGAGTIGILAMLAAKHFGGEVYLTDVASGKLAYAEKLGAAGTFVNSSPEALREWTAKTTSGDGFAATVEAVGLPATFNDAVESAASAGRVVLIGISKRNIQDFNFTLIQKKELAVFGSRNAVRQDFAEVIDVMLASGLSADSLVTNTYEFADAGIAFREFSERAGEMLKVLLRF
ncbi:MAG: zinc-binding alcohol dehydrogenase family protein [Planctomycetota bacterium]|jgi:2-desacetyl-2-hydroxyethyl bacteriochlorophyllide A dehydrogenase|nr:zinc-binding alcohol dehydrogenase family protein [Planctomycetota bacterium]